MDCSEEVTALTQVSEHDRMWCGCTMDGSGGVFSALDRAGCHGPALCGYHNNFLESASVSWKSFSDLNGA